MVLSGNIKLSFFFTLFLGLWDALNPYFSESLLTRSLLRVNLVIIS